MRERLLVTDDRPEMLRRIDRALGARYECEFADNVDDARARLADESFQLALCDVHAAGELALALAEEIVVEHTDTAVILVTGEDSPEVADRAFALGIHGYLVEPFWPGQLLITVMNALRWRQLEIAKTAQNQNLRDSFQAIIDGAPIPIYAKDASHRYVVANAKADELAGLKPGGSVGKTDSAFMDPAAAANAHLVDNQILEGGAAFEAEEPIVIAGVERTFKTVKFPLVDERADISAVCGISIDIISEKAEVRLRDELAAAQRRAIGELRLSREETVERLAKAIDLHDASTGEHVNRIGVIAEFLGGKLMLEPAEIDLLRVAAPMHDVGKIGISDDILRKPGPADRRRAHRHAAPHGDRLRDPLGVRERAPASRRDNRAHPSRALRRQGLSTGPERRADPAGGSDHRGRRRLRRPAQRSLLPAGHERRRSGRAARTRTGVPVRPGDPRCPAPAPRRGAFNADLRTTSDVARHSPSPAPRRPSRRK